MAEHNVTESVEKCRDCGMSYEERTGHVLGLTLRFGGGYCPACRAKRFAAEEKQEEEKRARELTERRDQWRRSCGIPRKYQDSRFERFDRKVGGNINRVREVCEHYAAGFSVRNARQAKSLLLYSHRLWGVGKTYMACSIAHAILDKWDGDYCPVYFVNEPDLFMRIRATYNRHSDQEHAETEQDIYGKLTRVPLLILDDVGKEEVADSRFVQRVLFAVINGRYDNMLPIVLTANLDPDELEAHLGGDRDNCASMERLLEMTGNIFWELKGTTYRDISKRMPSKT